jgi:tetratricopeptide (TPR) repeat protein
MNSVRIEGSSTLPEKKLQTTVAESWTWGRREWLFALVLSALAVIPYARLWDSGFINFDDNIYVTQNPPVFTGLSLSGFRWAWTTTHAANWHPLTWMSLQLDATFFGTQARGYHLTNVLLHLANTLLLFSVLRRMTGAALRSAVVAALFAAHPLHVESVAWISERKDLLSTFFGLVALYAYARYAEASTVTRYLAVAFAMVLSLLAKPMLVTLPALLLLLDYWPLGRWQPRFGQAGLEARPSPKSLPLPRLLLEKLPLVALAALSCAVTMWSQQLEGAVRSFQVLPLPDRLANALVSYGAYLKQAAVPMNLALLYPHTGTRLGLAALNAVLLAGATALVLWWGRRIPYVPVGWFWFLGTLVPVIGLVQVGEQARADRYTYLPLVGIFVVLTWGLTDLARRWRLERCAAGIAIVALALFALLSWTQVGYWHDSLRVWGHTLEVTDDNYIAHHNFGMALQDEAQWAEAIRHHEEALRINPRFALARNALGLALEKLGRGEEAVGQYQEALRLDPGYSAALTNLGAALEKSGKHADAVRHYQNAIRLEPTNALAHCNLASALQDEGKSDEAVQHYREALRLDPKLVLARIGFGLTLERLGRRTEAISSFREALRLDPHSVLAHVDLGAALENDGQRDEAVRHNEEALRLDPTCVIAHLNLGAILEKQQRIEMAIEHYRAVLRAQPNSDKGHYNMGTALAKLGRLDEALGYFTTALEINPNYVAAHYNLGLAQEQLGKADKGLSHYRRAVELAPGVAHYRVSLAAALFSSGRKDEAMAHYGEALRCDPKWPLATSQVAWALATHPDQRRRNAARAVTLAEQTCQATGNRQPRLLDTLAAAYAASGRFDRAVTVARQALSLAESENSPELAEAVRGRLRLYERKEAFRDQNLH